LTNKEIFKNKPVIVFWKHLVGEQKRIAAFDQMPNLWNLIKDKIVPFVKKITQRKKLQLLEMIIFNKPGTNNSEGGGKTLQKNLTVWIRKSPRSFLSRKAIFFLHSYYIEFFFRYIPRTRIIIEYIIK